jgi:hypothetical protein
MSRGWGATAKRVRWLNRFELVIVITVDRVCETVLNGLDCCGLSKRTRLKVVFLQTISHSADSQVLSEA